MAMPRTQQTISVGLGRSNVVTALAVALFLAAIAVAGIVGSIKDPGAPLGFVIGGLFTVVLIYFLIKVGPVLRPRAFEFAPDGFRFWHGRDNVFIPWVHVFAIGVEYEVKPEDPPELKMPPTSVDAVLDAAKDKVADFLNDKITEALQISGKRRLGLEIYPRAPELFSAYPRLQPYIRRQPPPRPGLPPDAWRLPLPPVVAIAQQVSNGAWAFFRPGWIGWYARAWNEPTR
jgi:hypothetical protein